MISSFADLGLPEALLAALNAAGHTHPTPIQAKAIPPVLAGSDLLGIAQTGTGKTGAFALPLLTQRLEVGGKAVPGAPKALILAPTRELAGQIADTMKLYGAGTRLRWGLVVGGMPQRPQTRALERGLHILIATPGRLIDLIDQGFCDLSQVETLVLDEADRMLDLGFQQPILEIASQVGERQTLLFSATMASTVERFAARLLREPVRVEVKGETVAVDRVAQHVHFMAHPEKRRFVTDLLQDPALARVILFTRTKHGAERLAEHLSRVEIAAEAIHGDKAQRQRQRALDRFRDGRARVLVATDVAARGIDVPEVSHVINFDLPNEAETYVHRIGRTARAGRHGIALSLCAPDETNYLRDIERLTGQDLGAGPAPRRSGPPPKRGRQNAPAKGHGQDRGRRPGRGRPAA